MSNHPPHDAPGPDPDDDVDALLALLPELGPDESAQSWFDRAVARLTGDGYPQAIASAHPALEVMQLAASIADAFDAPAAPALPFHDVDGRVTVHMMADGTLVEVRIQAGPYALNEMAGGRYLLVTSGDAPLRVPLRFDAQGEGSCILPDTASVRRALQRFRLIELEAPARP